ncbi:MAG: hypothetical protein ACYTG1_00410 [Planctomycetota bacterium]|jgi:ketosteroid isomerase-like protein
MPDPPGVNIFTRFVLENPWPLAGLLAVAAIAVAWPALREGRPGRTRPALGLAGAAAAVVAAALAVTTSGERARAVTRELVDSVVAGDLVAAVDLFSDDATVSLGSTTSPAYDRDVIVSGLDRATRYDVAGNRIRALRAYTVSGDEAEVHLGCLTDAGYGYTPSTWVLRVRREGDGEWRVIRLTCVSIATRPPPPPGRW